VAESAEEADEALSDQCDFEPIQAVLTVEDAKTGANLQRTIPQNLFSAPIIRGDIAKGG
jgi:hypothetical protein